MLLWTCREPGTRLSCWYADDSFDAAQLEGGVLLDDHPLAAVDRHDIADLRLGTVAIADPVRGVRLPQDYLEGAHALNLSGREDFARSGPGIPHSLLLETGTAPGGSPARTIIDRR